MEVMRFEFACPEDNEQEAVYGVQFAMPDHINISLEELMSNACHQAKYEAPSKLVLVRISKLVDDPSAAIPGYLIKEEYNVVDGKPILHYKQKGELDNSGIKSIW